MYLYQLMLKKQWLMLEEDEASSSSYYQPKPTRIKHFYDCGYDDIVKQLVNQPQSCKDFYPVLQQVGLPYQSYYDKIPDKVSNTLKTALHQEHAVLVQLPVINGYSGTASYSHDIKPISIVKKEPTFEPDDSWLVVDLLNHKPELIQILDASNNHQVTTAQTSPNEIFLKHGDMFSPTKVLPKVHIVLGGLGGSHDLALRGDKPLRVKQLAQSWLDELSTLLASGNSPFTIELDEAMASLINQKALPQRGIQAKQIDEHAAFRPDETVGVFFYHMLALLNHTDFITARQRIGTCGADESEGAIPDVKWLKSTLKALHVIRHSDGQDKPDYAYHSDTLSKTAHHYLGSPLVLDDSGGDNDAQSTLLTQVKIATEQDQLTDIESLYANAIKLLKHLREPGIIRHVETRREYQLKATKLDYRPVELKKLDFISFKLHRNYRYQISSAENTAQFVGRFNSGHRLNIKIPTKWSNIETWNLTATPVESDFVDAIFPTLKNQYQKMLSMSGFTLGESDVGVMYGNTMVGADKSLRNLGATMQIAGSVVSLYLAAAIGSTGIGTPLAGAIGFVAIDNLQAGVHTLFSEDTTTPYGAQFLEWAGVPKGYGELVYGMADISLMTKASYAIKTNNQLYNIVKVKPVKGVNSQQAIKAEEVSLSVENITKNQHHTIDLKNADEIPQIIKNAKQGKLYEKQEFLKLKSKYPNAVEQVSIKTERGTRFRIDALAKDTDTGEFILEEYKSSILAPLTKNQKIDFPEFTEFGGKIIGKGKEEFAGGTKISSGVKIQIIRPQNLNK